MSWAWLQVAGRLYPRGIDGGETNSILAVFDFQANVATPLSPVPNESTGGV